jgi:hypothetical protein
MEELGNVQLHATWGCALSCWSIRWWHQMHGTTMGLRISGWYLWAFKLPSIKCKSDRCPYLMPAYTITQPPLWGNFFTTLTDCSYGPIHWVWHLPSTVETRINLWKAHFSSVSVAMKAEHLPTEVGYDSELQSGQDRLCGYDVLSLKRRNAH